MPQSEDDLVLDDNAAVGAGENSAAAPPDGSAHEETQGALARSVSLVGAKVSTWGLAFVMTVIMPRYLGAEGYGRLYTAISLTGIMAILVEFGLNSLVAREVARRKEDAAKYLINASIIKVILWLVGSVVLGVGVRIAGYPVETQIATAVLALSVLVSSISSLVVAILQADDRMRWIAASTMLEKIVYVGFGVAVLVAGRGVVAVAVVTLLSIVAAALLDLWWLRRMSNEKPIRNGTETLDVKGLFVQALPFFSVLFFGAIYFRLDVVFLSLMTSDAVVGYYGAAYRLFQTTYILPEAFLFAFFPLFARLSPKAGDALGVAAQKSLDLLMLAGIPLTVGMAVLSSELISTLYGATHFSESIPILQTLSIAVVLMYANGVFVQLLIATDRQKKLALTAGIAAVLNVTANVILIPLFGALGAALATVVTELLVIVFNFSFLPSRLRSQFRFGTIVRIGLSAAFMAGVLLLLKGHLGLLGLLLAGIAAYFAAIFMLRAMPAEDWAMVRSAIANLRTA